VPTPVVNIDNLSDPLATVVEVSFGDLLGELLDTVRCFALRKTALEGQTRLGTRPPRAEPQRARRPSPRGRVTTRRRGATRTRYATSALHSARRVLMFPHASRHALLTTLYRIASQVQSLKNLGLDISRAEVGTEGSGRNRFYITDAKARAKPWPLVSPRVTAACADLGRATLRAPPAQRAAASHRRHGRPAAQRSARGTSLSPSRKHLLRRAPPADVGEGRAVGAAGGDPRHHHQQHD
jgi:hypothetical protein